MFLAGISNSNDFSAHHGLWVFTDTTANLRHSKAIACRAISISKYRFVNYPSYGACIQGAIFFATEFGYGLGAIHPLPNPPQTMRIIQLISSTITKLVYVDTGKLFYTLGFLPMYLIAATGVVLFVCFLLQIRECRKISVLLLFLIGCSLMATSISRRIRRQSECLP